MNAYLPALLAVSVTFVWAWLSPAMSVWFFRDLSEHKVVARGVLGVSTAAFGGVICYGALGPELTGAPSIPFVLGVAALSAGVTVWRLDRLVSVDCEKHEVEVSAGRIAALVLSVMGIVVAAWFSARLLTSVDDGVEATVGQARRGVLFDPWNAEAWLALCRSSIAQGDFGVAEQRRDAAIRAGLDDARSLELLAELLTAQGDCEGARGAFESALEARAQSAMENWELDLEGSYWLPENFIRECGLYDAGAGLPVEGR